jgi:hypothetical protein
MTDSPPINSWKRIAIRSFFGGVGVAVTLGIITGGAIWYDSRPKPPKPWNTKAVTATWDTMEFTVGASNEIYSFPVQFYYDVKNNTDKNFDIKDANLKPMAVLADGNAFSKEFGQYQDGAATVDGPDFIPPGGTGRVTLQVSYFFPQDYTKADKADGSKIVKVLNFRLKELGGFVLFDELNRYQIDLLKGWKDSYTPATGTESSDKKP